MANPSCDTIPCFACQSPVSLSDEKLHIIICGCSISSLVCHRCMSISGQSCKDFKACNHCLRKKRMKSCRHAYKISCRYCKVFGSIIMDSSYRSIYQLWRKYQDHVSNTESPFFAFLASDWRAFSKYYRANSLDLISADSSILNMIDVMHGLRQIFLCRIPLQIRLYKNIEPIYSNPWQLEHSLQVTSRKNFDLKYLRITWTRKLVCKLFASVAIERKITNHLLMLLITRIWIIIYQCFTTFIVKKDSTQNFWSFHNEWIERIYCDVNILTHTSQFSGPKTWHAQQPACSQ